MENLFSFLKRYDSVDGRRLPPSEQYNGYRPVVGLIQVFAVLLVTYLGFLWFRETLRTPGIVWIIIPLFVAFISCLYVAAIAVALLIDMAAKSYIKNQCVEEADELYEICNLQWYGVTPQMQEYLDRSKRILLLLAAVVVAGVAVMAYIDGFYGLVSAVAVLYLLRIVSAMSGGNVFQYGNSTEYAVADISSTFTRFGVRYAVVYLPVGKRVYRIDKKAGDEPERLVFISSRKNACLICDEEFLNLI